MQLALRRDESLNVPEQRFLIAVKARDHRLQEYFRLKPLQIDRMTGLIGDERQEGRLRKGDLVVMVSFGGGLTWGASLVQF